MPPDTLRGSCRVLYCFDLARSIDLARAEERLASARRATFHHKGGFPAEAGVARPVRVSWQAPAVALDADGAATLEQVEIALYDFGAAAITWTVPVERPLEGLVDLSIALYDNAALIERSRALALEVQSALGDAADRPELHALFEDFAVFELAPPPGGTLTLLTASRETLARVLRAEPGELSGQEVEDALSAPVSYGRDDAVLVDWLGAILFGDDTFDERLLLELATVELLELRLLDDRLDRETEAAYELLTRPRRPFGSWTTLRRELERLARAEADDALLHQGIDNALKLFGDDYLARLYRTASARFHFDDWDAAIGRKVGTLRSIYDSLADQASHRRSEVLEWIIIVLIAVDIVLYFTPWH